MKDENIKRYKPIPLLNFKDVDGQIKLAKKAYYLEREIKSQINDTKVAQLVDSWVTKSIISIEKKYDRIMQIVFALTYRFFADQKMNGIQSQISLVYPFFQFKTLEDYKNISTLDFYNHILPGIALARVMMQIDVFKNNTKIEIPIVFSKEMIINYENFHNILINYGYNLKPQSFAEIMDNPNERFAVNFEKVRKRIK